MSEMTENQTAKIRKGLSARRVPTCFQVQEDIVIPAGTVLRHIGGDKFGAAIGCAIVELVLTAEAGQAIPSLYKRVIA